MHVDAVAAGNAYEEGNQAVMEGHSRWGCWWPHDGVATPNQDGGNLLVMPTLDAAHIAFGLLRELGGGQKVGPILLGMAEPVHVLDNSSTVRSIVNMTALCVVEAQDRAAGAKRG